MVSLVLGFLFGVFYALFIAFIMAVGSSIDPYASQEFGAISAGILVIFVPIFMAFFMAVSNSIAALVCAVVYNFVARTMGGIEYDVEVLSGGSLVQQQPPQYSRQC